MSGVLLAARLVLIAVFTLSGTTKAIDRQGTTDASLELGVPSPWAGLVAVGLPVAELGVAGLLVWPATAWWGGLGALVLLAAFSVVIAVNLGRGRTPDCHCFGEFRSAPVSARMLARNAVLAVPAVLLVLAA